MGKKSGVKKILIINKFAPGDKDVTGKAAFELGEYLSTRQYSVQYLAVKGRGKNNNPDETVFAGTDVVRVSNVHLGKGTMALLLSSLLQGFLLFVKASLIKKQAAIVMTAPAMLNVFGVFLTKISRSKVIFWTMDLYPEAFAASGAVKESNALYQLLKQFVYRHPAQAYITLGQQQMNYLSRQYQKKINAIVLPCGIETVIPATQAPVWLKEEAAQKIKFCYAGNVGEAHDEHFLIAFAKALQPDKHVLYINLYGAKAQKVLAAIENLPAIVKIDYLTYAQMHFIDVHLASLLSHWDHVCVPSKAVSAICAGAVLLLNTSTACDGWQMFQEASWLIEQKQGDYQNDIHLFLSKVDQAQIALKKKNAFILATALLQQQAAAYENIGQWLMESK